MMGSLFWLVLGLFWLVVPGAGFVLGGGGWWWVNLNDGGWW